MEHPRWEQKYSGEVFDRAQKLAAVLTEADRADGRPAPAYGYSSERFAEATRVVQRANAWAAGP